MSTTLVCEVWTASTAAALQAEATALTKVPEGREREAEVELWRRQAASRLREKAVAGVGANRPEAAGGVAYSKTR